MLTDWLPWLINHIQPFFHCGPLSTGIAAIFFGFGAVTYARHPEGILEANKRQALDWVQRRIDRFKGSGGAASVPPPTEVSAPAPAGSAP